MRWKEIRLTEQLRLNNSNYQIADLKVRLPVGTVAACLPKGWGLLTTDRADNLKCPNLIWYGYIKQLVVVEANY